MYDQNKKNEKKDRGNALIYNTLSFQLFIAKNRSLGLHSIPNVREVMHLKFHRLSLLQIAPMGNGRFADRRENCELSSLL